MHVNSYLIYESISHTYERISFDTKGKLETLIKLHANFFCLSWQSALTHKSVVAKQGI